MEYPNNKNGSLNLCLFMMFLHLNSYLSLEWGAWIFQEVNEKVLNLVKKVI